MVLCGKVVPHCGFLVVKDPPGAASFVPGILGMNVILHCDQKLFGSNGLSLFNLPLFMQASGPVTEVLQQCHKATIQSHDKSTGVVRVRGSWVVCIPGGIMKLVASTGPEQFSATLHFLSPQSLACQLASPCLVHVVRGTAYILVVNVGTTVLYPPRCPEHCSSCQCPLPPELLFLPLFLPSWLPVQSRVGLKR